jgi:hypothetical protein
MTGVAWTIAMFASGDVATIVHYVVNLYSALSVVKNMGVDGVQDGRRR